MFVNTGTTESAAKLVATKKAANPSADYWRICYQVVLAAGKVAKMENLIKNYRDESTRHAVAPTVENKQTFPNGIKSVHDARKAAMEAFFQIVDHLNEFALKHQRDQVTGMELLSRFYDGAERDKIRTRIEQYIEKSHPPIPLNEIQS